MLGRGRTASSPSTIPRPGWVEHDAEEILRVSLEAMREALAAAGERPAGIGITNQRETVVLWDRRTLAPVAPRHRLAGPPHQRALPRAARDRRRERCCASAPGWWPIPISPPPSSSGCCATPTLRRRAERGELAAGTVESWLVARLTGGRVHVTDHTNASRTLLYDLAARDWDPELLELFGVPPEMLPRDRALGGVGGRDRRRRIWARACPIAGLAGDQQAALFGQGCCRDGLGQEHLRHRRVPPGLHGRPAARRRRQGVLATAACGPRGEPAYALEGSVFIAGAAVQWLRDGLGLIRTAGRDRGAGPQRAGHRRRALRPGVRRPRHAALGGRGARDDHRPHPRHDPRAPGPRGARGDGVQQRRAARRR